MPRETEITEEAEIYGKGYGDGRMAGLEEGAKVAETKKWSKRRTIADLIRQRKMSV